MGPTRKNCIARSSIALRCAYLLFCGLSVAVGATSALAEELSHDEMVCALDPQCTIPVTNRRLRGISATPNIHSTPGSFDRTVNFVFNSAELTPEARSELDKVAAVLKDPNIEKYTIIIHGHTDGVGSVEYNQNLSEQRAASARQYFISQHGIDPSRLISKGHGKSQLLMPSDPTNGANRRVQFENANYTTAATPATSAPTAAAAAAAPATPAPKVSPQPTVQTSKPNAPAARPTSSGAANDGL
jgi:outer membrane protein OmpA-like peptidoglycan-associated protein